jgi:hypothetical protein
MGVAVALDVAQVGTIGLQDIGVPAGVGSARQCR